MTFTFSASQSTSFHGLPVTQDNCDGRETQRWTISEVGPGMYAFVVNFSNPASGFPPGMSFARLASDWNQIDPGTPVVGYDVFDLTGPNPHQSFHALPSIPSSTRTVDIFAIDSMGEIQTTCIETPDFSLQPDEQLQLGECAGWPSQHWTLVPVF